MKHIGRVSLDRELFERSVAQGEPGTADAKTDYQNALWRNLWDYVLAKKTGAM